MSTESHYVRMGVTFLKNHEALISHWSDLKDRNERQAEEYRLLTHKMFLVGCNEGHEYELLNAEAARILLAKGKVREAVCYGGVPTARLALQKGISANDLIFDAARHGSAELIEFLLLQGVDTEIRNQYNFTPLHLAACDGNCEAIRALVKGGADVHSFCDAYDGHRPLGTAVSYGQCKAGLLLLELGANPDDEDAIDKAGHILYTIRVNHFEEPNDGDRADAAIKIVKRMIELGGEPVRKMAIESFDEDAYKLDR